MRGGALRYLITGGAGFIGSHLGDALVGRSHAVVSLDNFATGDPTNLERLKSAPKFENVVGSVLDLSLVNARRRGRRRRASGGRCRVRLITEHPLRSLETNVVGTLNVLNAADRFRKPVVIASTSEVYGRASGPVTEDAFRIVGATSSPRWSYAAAKTLDETLALAYWDEHHLPVIIARFFNTVGPRQTGSYGMAFRVGRQSLTGQDLTVYGDGSQSPCFCHVSDTVRAVINLLDDSRAIGNVFNIGSTEEVSILEAAQRVLARTGSTSAIELVPYDEVYGGRFEDLPKRVPDCTKIQELTGWIPERTFDTIVDDIAEYPQRGPEHLLRETPKAASAPNRQDAPTEPSVVGSLEPRTRPPLRGQASLQIGGLTALLEISVRSSPCRGRHRFVVRCSRIREP